MNIMNIFKQGGNKSPLERAILRWIEFLVYSFVVSGGYASATYIYNNESAVDWQHALLIFLITGGFSTALALVKYFKAQGDKPLTSDLPGVTYGDVANIVNQGVQLLANHLNVSLLNMQQPPSIDDIEKLISGYTTQASAVMNAQIQSLATKVGQPPTTQTSTPAIKKTQLTPDPQPQQSSNAASATESSPTVDQSAFANMDSGVLRAAFVPSK